MGFGTDNSPTPAFTFPDLPLRASVRQRFKVHIDNPVSLATSSTDFPLCSISSNTRSRSPARGDLRSLSTTHVSPIDIAVLIPHTLSPLLLHIYPVLRRTLTLFRSRNNDVYSESAFIPSWVGQGRCG